MRGFKVDHMATALARLEGEFLLTDARSFVSQPKITNHTNGVALHHLLLKGADKGAMRAEIFRLDREQNGDENKCWECGRIVIESEEDYGFDMGYTVGQWHHINSKAGQRCDCRQNGAVSCDRCHRSAHLKVEWSKTA